MPAYGPEDEAGASHASVNVMRSRRPVTGHARRCRTRRSALATSAASAASPAAGRLPVRALPRRAAAVPSRSAVPSGRVRAFHGGVPDQAAVQALNLVQPPDQVQAPAAGARLEASPTSRACRWHAGQTSTRCSRTTPRFHGLGPRSGSDCRAPQRWQGIFRHFPHHASFGGYASSASALLVVGDVACLRDRVDDLPAHDAFLVDDEGAADGQALRLVEHPVGLGDGTVRPEVRQQPELEVLRVRPGAVGEERVHRHRQQLYVVPGRISGKSSRSAHISPLQTGLKASG